VTPLLTLQRIRVEAGGQRLLELDHLEVPRSKTLAVVGPTGAGKSTLLRVMNGLVVPAAGCILWDDAPIPTPMPLPVRRRMAMAFQEPLLFRGTVLDNVLFGLRVRGVSGAAARKRALEALRTLAVEHLSRRSCASLSGGEAHRVSLARVLVLRPELLLLDEPLASLDAVTREHLGDQLRRIVRDEQLTCVYVTHDQIEARAIADRIAVIDRGSLLQEGAPDDVFLRPASERVAHFVQTRNMLPGEVVRQDGGIAEVRVGTHVVQAVSDAAVGRRVTVCIRPEHIVLSRDAGDSSARNHLRAPISAILPRGPVAEIVCAASPDLVVLVTRRSLDDLSLRVGDVVDAAFKATAAHVVDSNQVILDDSSQ